jgi:hypothetical protein
MTEQFKRLKLLISLKEYAQAADGFALIKEQNMQKAIQNVETSTDIIYYSRELSKSFFLELYNCVSLYHTLFSDQQQNENSEIVMLLVQWTQNQIAHFIQALVKQVNLVVSESAMLWIIHLRDQGQWRLTTNAAMFSNVSSMDMSERESSEMIRRPSTNFMNITPTKSSRSRPRRQVRPRAVVFSYLTLLCQCIVLLLEYTNSTISRRHGRK